MILSQSPNQPRGQTLSLGQAAALMGRSERWVQGLAKAGYVDKAARGEYALVSLIRGALAYYEDQLAKNNKSAAATKASEARTREIELRIQERSRELMPTEDARAVIGELAALFRAEFGGLPARFTRDLEARRALEQEVDGSLERIAGQAQQASQSLALGSLDSTARQEAEPSSLGG
jgi:hypothetical protein